MLLWLWRLVIGRRSMVCFHKWDVYLTTEVYDAALSSKVPLGNKYTLRCIKCGDMTVRKGY